MGNLMAGAQQSSGPQAWLPCRLDQTTQEGVKVAADWAAWVVMDKDWAPMEDKQEVSSDSGAIFVWAPNPVLEHRLKKRQRVQRTSTQLLGSGADRCQAEDWAGNSEVGISAMGGWWLAGANFGDMTSIKDADSGPGVTSADEVVSGAAPGCSRPDCVGQLCEQPQNRDQEGRNFLAEMTDSGMPQDLQQK